MSAIGVDQDMDENNRKTVIRNIGKKLIDDYCTDGIIRCGINGPYDDEETRVRNLSHLLVITAIEVGVYQKEEYRQLIDKMGKELLNLSESDGQYVLRKKQSKDKCNGVIGHAWVMEGLCYYYSISHNEDVIAQLKKIVQLHDFNRKLKLWMIPGSDGKIDYTLNHQLWYTAALVEANSILHDSVVADNINFFMQNLPQIFMVNRNGRVKHGIIKRDNHVDYAKQIFKHVVMSMNEVCGRPSMKYKEEGYHVFNLMALARIYAIKTDYSFFTTEKFQRALSYVNTAYFTEGLKNRKVELDVSLKNNIKNEDELRMNIYGYPYNVPGLELLYVNSVFKCFDTDTVVADCLDEQINLTMDDSGMLTKCCHDKNTINYRVYEYYRYLERVECGE